MRLISRFICSSVSCMSKARFCLLRLKLVTWFLFSYAIRERDGERSSKVKGNRAHTQCIAYTHPCDCQLGLLVSVLGSLLAFDLFVFFIRLAICPVTSVYRRRAMYLDISHLIHTLTLPNVCCVCIECTFAGPSAGTEWCTKRAFLAQFALFTRIHL